MKARPLIFTGWKVRYILGLLEGQEFQTRRVVRPNARRDALMLAGEEPDWCPYGRPGDRLWVRETWAEWPSKREYIYRADHEGTEFDAKLKWRPSIYMPRWASRLTLESVSVRVERLQEINGDDIAAEMGWLPCDCGPSCSCAPDMFRPIWDRINGHRAPWSSNPWVWALTLRRLP